MIEFTVWGEPKSQGSFRAVSHKASGKAILLQDSKNTLPWRQQVTGAALHAGAVELEGAVFVTLTCWFVRPKSVSAAKRPKPEVKPDIDKLERAVLDALTGVCFKDDAQVTTALTMKRYGEKACCVVRVEADLDEAEIPY